MPTRNVVLTPQHEKIIADLVGSGRYQNASEVLGGGLRLVEQRDAVMTAKLRALQEMARAGFAELDSGFYQEIEDSGLEAAIGELRASE